MPAEDSRARGGLAGPLAGVAVLLAVLALVLSYAGRAVLQAEPFADRAVATLKAPAVQADVADHLTDVVVRQFGDLVTVRPVVRAVVGAIVGSGAFAALFRRAALELHASLVAGHGSALLLTVADAGVLIQGALERLAPDAARQVGADRLARLGALRPGGAVLAVVRFARRVYTIAWALAAAALLLALARFLALARPTPHHPAAGNRARGRRACDRGSVHVRRYGRRECRRRGPQRSRERRLERVRARSVRAGADGRGRGCDRRGGRCGWRPGSGPLAAGSATDAPRSRGALAAGDRSRSGDRARAGSSADDCGLRRGSVPGVHRGARHHRRRRGVGGRAAVRGGA